MVKSPEDTEAGREEGQVMGSPSSTNNGAEMLSLQGACYHKTQINI